MYTFLIDRKEVQGRVAVAEVNCSVGSIGAAVYNLGLVVAAVEVVPFGRL